MHKLVDALLKEITWFAKADEITLKRDEERMVVSDEFVSVFPQMGQLLRQAVKLELEVKGKIYWLICWEKNNVISGWLCLPAEKEVKKAIPKSFHLILNVFGGIVESFGISAEKENYLCNMNSILCLQDAAEGIANWEEYFYCCCESENVNPTIALEQFIVIAVEANGNLTLCNKDSEDILLFAPDHAFDYVEAYHHYPEYTFYTIIGCPTFRSWIETIAKQWTS